MLNIEKELENIKSRMIGDSSLPGSGWNHIIAKLNMKLSMLDPEYRILQVKEKFGTLRFYYETDTKVRAVKEAMDRYTRYAEIESSSICEQCGAHGELTSRKIGWMKTRCGNCSATESFKEVNS